MSNQASVDREQLIPSLLLVGTTKGLVIFEKGVNGWEVQQVLFLGMSINIVYTDPINATWWVSISHHHWGQKLQYSKDKGATWQSVPTPKYPADATLPTGKAAILKKIWCIQQGGPLHPNRLWIGTEPGGLFISDNYGQSFSLVKSLWNHPSRMNRLQWFGTGRSEPYIHSIVIDPRDTQHIYIAVSCAGIFETTNGGQTWYPRNKGLVAAYLPNPTAEIGHDPHLLLACKNQPDILWQQNHCGIFRSTDGAATWENITDQNGLANYGFALAIDQDQPTKAWVIPATSDAIRVAPNLALSVCYTEDAGSTWLPLRNGLPQHYAFDIVFRHAFTKQGKILAFGTNTGNLYLSENEGKNWSCLSHSLARVECVGFSVL